jgi:hypothetical protein
MTYKHKLAHTSLLAITALLSVLPLTASTGTAAKKLKVYMVQGKGATSILDEKEYQSVLQGIFKEHSLTIDLSAGKEKFLQNFFESDIIYLSLHANPSEWKVSNGEVLQVQDLVGAYKQYKRAPALVIVTGCETILSTGHESNFAQAIGIQSNTAKRAYIGFKKPVRGYFADRYFRVFLASWLSSKPDGGLRTLEESRVFAKQFIDRRLKTQPDTLGEVAKFGVFDPDVADELSIIGDKNLRATDW